jgi:nuclear RNA export factor
MRISQTTSMNLEWSKKCLAENEWEFNKAVTAFTLLHGQGKIPREAFQ